MTFIKKYINKFFAPEGMDFPENQGTGNHTFYLYYGDLIIGYLLFEETRWKFVYSEQFKGQDEIAPLPDFPDKAKVYTSSQLWPFFAARIPSISTPYVEKKVKKDGIDKNNLLEMLKAFGERSINNPFRLSVQ